MKVENLSVRYGNVQALKDINFEFKSPASVAVIGHNGSGKTTMLECMMGLRQADTGKIDAGHEIKSSDLKEKLGVVLQENNFYDSIKVNELLHLFSTYYKETLDIHYLTDLLEINAYKDRYYHRLSGGMKQKVNLALAFLNKPTVVILDEPTTGLDPYAREEFWKTLRALCDDTLLFLSSHYMEEVQENCEYVIFLKDGEAVFIGKIADLLKREQSDSLKDVYMKLM